jgi:hypothetical protein
MKNLLKISFLIVAFFYAFTIDAQSFGISGGVLANSFYDFARDKGHFSTSNEVGGGYIFSLYLNEVQVKNRSLMFHLRYEKYNGKSFVSDGGLGGGYGSRVLANKQKMGLVFYPVNFELHKRIEINFGINVNFLIASQSTARRSSWRYNMETTYTTIEGKIDASLGLGPQMRIAFKFPLGQNWAVVPQVQLYWGLLDEFQEVFSHNVMSIRQYVEVGLQRNLNH